MRTSFLLFAFLATTTVADNNPAAAATDITIGDVIDLSKLLEATQDALSDSDIADHVDEVVGVKDAVDNLFSSVSSIQNQIPDVIAEINPCAHLTFSPDGWPNGQIELGSEDQLEPNKDCNGTATLRLDRRDAAVDHLMDDVGFVLEKYGPLTSLVLGQATPSPELLRGATRIEDISHQLDAWFNQVNATIKATAELKPEPSFTTLVTHVSSLPDSVNPDVGLDNGKDNGEGNQGGFNGKNDGIGGGMGNGNGNGNQNVGGYNGNNNGQGGGTHNGNGNGNGNHGGYNGNNNGNGGGTHNGQNNGNGNGGSGGKGGVGGVSHVSHVPHKSYVPHVPSHVPYVPQPHSRVSYTPPWLQHGHGY